MDENPDSGGSLGLFLWETLLTIAVCLLAAVVMVRVFGGAAGAVVAAIWGIFWGIFAGVRVSSSTLAAGFLGLIIVIICGLVFFSYDQTNGLIVVIFASLSAASALFVRMHIGNNKFV
ncbi:MAG: hypothetical protein HYT03_01980 [Candidatus Harrisonbacteria bacterium]|nr:hypothetical protein [Candidatus Harrisonbacteria bacterium]